jgi:tetratricopeptide (TPR) repeat protein
MTAEPLAAQEPQVDPAFRERMDAVIHGWQGGATTYQAAVDSLNALRQEATDAGSIVHEGAIENTFGIMHGYRSNLNQSLVHFENARRLYEQAGARSRLANCDLNIGETYRHKGNFTRARACFHQAYEQAKQFDLLSIQSIALTNEAQMWISLRSYEKARETLQKVLSFCEQPWSSPETDRDRQGRLDNNCEMYVAFVEVYLEQNRVEEAWLHARQAFEIARILKRPLRTGFANRAVGNVVTRMEHLPDTSFSGNPDDYYRAALEAFRDVKAEGEVGKTLFAQGKSHAHRGKKRSAAGLFQQAMVIFTRLGMTDDAAKAAEAQLDVI